MENSQEINKLKSCLMIEIPRNIAHTKSDKDITCECSECNHKITASADFNSNGRLLKVYFPIHTCPNCGADIVRFVLYKI